MSCRFSVFLAIVFSLAIGCKPKPATHSDAKETWNAFKGETLELGCPALLFNMSFSDGGFRPWGISPNEGCKLFSKTSLSNEQFEIALAKNPYTTLGLHQSAVRNCKQEALGRIGSTFAKVAGEQERAVTAEYYFLMKTFEQNIMLNLHLIQGLDVLAGVPSLTESKSGKASYGRKWFPRLALMTQKLQSCRPQHDAFQKVLMHSRKVMRSYLYSKYRFQKYLQIRAREETFPEGYRLLKNVTEAEDQIKLILAAVPWLNNRKLAGFREWGNVLNRDTLADIPWLMGKVRVHDPFVVPDETAIRIFEERLAAPTNANPSPSDKLNGKSFAQALKEAIIDTRDTLLVEVDKLAEGARCLHTVNPDDGNACRKHITYLMENFPAYNSALVESGGNALHSDVSLAFSSAQCRQEIRGANLEMDKAVLDSVALVAMGGMSVAASATARALEAARIIGDSAKAAQYAVRAAGLAKYVNGIDLLVNKQIMEQVLGKCAATLGGAGEVQKGQFAVQEWARLALNPGQARCVSEDPSESFAAETVSRFQGCMAEVVITSALAYLGVRTNINSLLR